MSLTEQKRLYANHKKSKTKYMLLMCERNICSLITGKRDKRLNLLYLSAVSFCIYRKSRETENFRDVSLKSNINCLYYPNCWCPCHYFVIHLAKKKCKLTARMHMTGRNLYFMCNLLVKYSLRLSIEKPRITYSMTIRWKNNLPIVSRMAQ